MSTEPFGSPEAKRRYVVGMFAKTARHYDRMNRVISLGRDLSWRCALVERANLRPGAAVLDVAAGTGDVTIMLARRLQQGHIVGLDLSRPMLTLATQKLAANGLGGVSLIQGDGLRLPFAENTFDAVTSAFALRNVTDVPALFAEMQRVLRPEGRLACMEISRPPSPLFGRLFGFYFNRVVPWLGRILARDPEAYAYLPDSLNRFMSKEQVIRTLRELGFRWVGCQSLMLGTVSIYVGLK